MASARSHVALEAASRMVSFRRASKCPSKGRLRGNQSRTCCPEELEDLLLDNLAEDVGKIPPTRDSGGRIEAPLDRCAWD